MVKGSSESPVRIIGSRELHQNLPTIMRDLEGTDARYVLTVHGKPKAVLVGASNYLELLQGKQQISSTLLGLQLSALLGTDYQESAIEPQPTNPPGILEA